MSLTTPQSHLLQVWARAERIQGPGNTGRGEAGEKPRKDKTEPMEMGLLLWDGASTQPLKPDVKPWSVQEGAFLHKDIPKAASAPGFT